MRKMMKISVALSLLFFAGRACGEEKKKDMWSEGQARITAGRLIADIEEAEAKAIELLSQTEKAWLPKNAANAMKFLGFIRSRNAVPVLCERLLYETPWRSPVGIRVMFPASKALVEIGLPAVEGLLKKIAGNDSEKKYKIIALSVIGEILGRDNELPAIRKYKEGLNPSDRARLDQLEKDTPAYHSTLPEHTEEELKKLKEEWQKRLKERSKRVRLRSKKFNPNSPKDATPKVKTGRKGLSKPKDVPTEGQRALRTWTDITGKNTVEARLVELKQGKVWLKKADGETISLPVSQLSKANQEYVKKTFPESFPKKPAPKKPAPKKPTQK